MRAFTEGCYHLIQAIEIDIEVLPAQLRPVVFHPLPQVEIVVKGHGQGSNLLHCK